MYKNLYENAGKIADQIREGSFKTPSKQTMEREAGLFSRRTLELAEPDSDPVETISRYIAGIRDSAIEDPQEHLLGTGDYDEGPSLFYSGIRDDVPQRDLTSGENFDYSQVSEIEAMQDASFVEAAEQVAANLGVPVNWMYAVMQTESGINPSQANILYEQQGRNPAMGLIQFMPTTAEGLGTSTEELRNMSRTEQLTYVERFYETYADKIQSPEDMYLATFYPRALGEGDSFVLGSEVSSERASEVRRDNSPYDLNGDGTITVGEVKQAYRNTSGYQSFIAPFLDNNSRSGN